MYCRMVFLGRKSEQHKEKTDVLPTCAQLLYATAQPNHNVRHHHQSL